MQQMQVGLQLVHDTLRNRARAPERTTEFVLIKDQRAWRRFRPIMDVHVRRYVKEQANAHHMTAAGSTGLFDADGARTFRQRSQDS